MFLELRALLRLRHGVGIISLGGSLFRRLFTRVRAGYSRWLIKGSLDFAKEFGFEIDLVRFGVSRRAGSIALWLCFGGPVITDDTRQFRKRIVVVDHASGASGLVVILISHLNSHTRLRRYCQSNVGKWWRYRISSGASVPVICNPDFSTQATA